MFSRRKFLLHSILLLFLILASAIFYLGQRWQAFQEENGLSGIETQGWRLSADGLYLERLRMVQADDRGRTELELSQLSLGVNRWWNPLPLQSLRIANLKVTWQPSANAVEQDTDDVGMPVPKLEQLESWSSWVPRKGRVDALELYLPCHSGVCHERASLNWTRSSDRLLPMTAQLQVKRAPYDLTLKARGHREASDTHVALDLHLGGLQRLSLLNRFSPENGSTLWSGALAMSELPEAEWLQQWLGEWLPYQLPDVMHLPTQMHLGAAWTFAFDSNALPDSLERLTGDLRLSSELPLLWPVPGIGLLQGHLDLAVHAEQGNWLPTELAADLQIQPDSALFAAVPASLRPEWLRLVAAPDTMLEDGTRLPLHLQLEASGPASASFDARLLLEAAEPYGMTIEQGRLELNARQVPELDASGLTAKILFNGKASGQDADIKLSKGSQIGLASLANGPTLAAEKLRLDLSGLDISIHPDEQSVAFAGPLLVEMGLLKHPSLRPQGWRWRSELVGDLNQITVKGPLENDTGLKLNLNLRHSLAQASTRLNIQLPDLYLRAGNPLSTTLLDWPATLELSNGNLQAQGQLTLTGSKSPSFSATIKAKGLGGIFDRSELSGLDAELSLSLKQDQLQVAIPELRLQQANPGLLLGPLLFQGQYSANLQQADQGRLAWSTAELQVLGGKLWLSPGDADLSAPLQKLSIHLRDLPLAGVLEAYPTEGLAGTGIIDGELHFQRSAEGVSIDQGTLQARPPGGTLQFRSAKIQALGQANPAMRLVAQALDDFRYDVLTSDVRYATDGTLNLGLRLHGHNPTLEGGRPINLSVNLEEDLPALLTSLQLSDRVSETIQRRVQERIRKRSLENHGQ